MTNKGFTLIEMLVSTAIVGTLIGITLPSLAKAKKESERIKCQSNLREWSGIIEQDRMNWKGDYVWAYDIRKFRDYIVQQTGLKAPRRLTNDPVSPIEADGIFLCPSNKEKMERYIDNGGLSYDYQGVHYESKSDWVRTSRYWELNNGLNNWNLKQQLMIDTEKRHNGKYNVLYFDKSIRMWDGKWR